MSRGGRGGRPRLVTLFKKLSVSAATGPFFSPWEKTQRMKALMKGVGLLIRHGALVAEQVPTRGYGPVPLGESSNIEGGVQLPGWV